MPILTSKSEWQALVDYCYSLPPEERIMGLDSEYEGVCHDTKEIVNDEYWRTSCVVNAEIVVLSVAFGTGEIHPRGYEKAKGAVLHRDALAFNPIRDMLEDPGVIKPCHNSNVDVHAFRNKGIDCNGIINTLGLARWMLPGRMAYNLDALGTDCLGIGKTESFRDLMYYPNMITVLKDKTIKVCDCGEPKCRKRKGHNKTEVVIQEEVDKQDGWCRISQFEVADNPLHSLHKRYEDYAKRDAVVAWSLFDYLMSIETLTEVPWYS